MQNKKSKGKSDIQKDEVLQAVVVTDSFNRNFYPMDQPYCLLPLVNKCLLEYTLEYLHFAGIEEIIVFCTSHVDKIKDILQKIEGKLNGTLLTIIVSDGCHSFGDVMRDIDGKAIIRSDFILVTGDIVSNINLLSALKSFKKKNSFDSGAVATILYKKTGHPDKDQKENQLVVYDSNSNKLLLHKIADEKNINLPMEHVLQYPRIEICLDLSNTGIMVCSPAVPPLFADNFDFQTQDQFIKGILMNEEILDCRLYCNVVDNCEYGFRVKDWPSYQVVSRDVIQHRVYPFVPCYKYRRNNIYLGDSVVIGKSSTLMQQVVIGEGTEVGENAELAHCVIGKNCKIGSNVKLKHAYLFDNVSIANNCEIIYSVLSSGSVVRQDSKLLDGCLIGTNVEVDKKSCLTGVKLTSAGADVTDMGEDGSDEEDIPTLRCESAMQIEDESGSDSEDSESNVSEDTPPLDDTRLFYTEVLDSLLRGFEEKLVCDNLVLEINSSRYVYNVTVKEVNFFTVKAILFVGNKPNMDVKSFHSHLMSKLHYFLPLFKNYIKNNVAQEDCLAALVEAAQEIELLSRVAGKMLHYLYDKDILDEENILEWFKNLEQSPLKKDVEAFIQWLEASEEEESD